MLWVNGSRCARGEPHRSRLPAAIEGLEQRMMLSVSGWIESSITDMSGYSMLAEVRFGSNGWEDPGAVDGMVLASADGEIAGAPASWDDNLFDGLDSGWNDVRFSANVEGTDHILWTVGEFDSLSPYMDLCGSIGSIAIRAGVLGSGMGMMWQNVVVQFKRDGQLMESVFVGSVGVDRRGSSEELAAESVVLVVPSAPDYDEFIVTGAVRMVSNPGMWPGPYDIFGQVFVYETVFERPLDVVPDELVLLGDIDPWVEWAPETVERAGAIRSDEIGIRLYGDVSVRVTD